MEQPNEALGVLAGLLFFVVVLLLVFSPFLILVIGGLVGAAQERRHFEELARREQALGGFLLTDLRTPPPGLQVAAGALVSGSVVIAADHFKTFCAGWRKVFGGEFRSLARMQERARREAILRMVEEARRIGATSICNVRVETSTIGARQEGKVSGCELVAYGTALIPAVPGATAPGGAPPPLPGSPR
jgi:uncharacterized protein YbjQ (UPF0145 family)